MQMGDKKGFSFPTSTSSTCSSHLTKSNVDPYVHARREVTFRVVSLFVRLSHIQRVQQALILFSLHGSDSKAIKLQVDSCEPDHT